MVTFAHPPQRSRYLQIRATSVASAASTIKSGHPRALAPSKNLRHPAHPRPPSLARLERKHRAPERGALLRARRPPPPARMLTRRSARTGPTPLPSLSPRRRALLPRRRAEARLRLVSPGLPPRPRPGHRPPRHRLPTGPPQPCAPPGRQNAREAAPPSAAPGQGARHLHFEGAWTSLNTPDASRKPGRAAGGRARGTPSPRPVEGVFCYISDLGGHRRLRPAQGLAVCRSWRGAIRSAVEAPTWPHAR